MLTAGSASYIVLPMIEIGKSTLKPVRKRDKGTGKLTVVLGSDNKPETRIVSNEVVRVTRDTLGGSFGPDRNRKLVVKLAAGDVLVLWPQGTRQKVSIEISQVYRQALQHKAQVALLEKARKRKAQKAEQRASRKVAYYDKKLRKIVIPKNPLSPVDPRW